MGYSPRDHKESDTTEATESLVSYIFDYLPHQTPSYLPASTFAAFYFLYHCLVKSFGLLKFSSKDFPL